MRIVEFLTGMEEDLINRGLDSWQIRQDDTELIGDSIKVILKDVMVRTDLEAFKENKKVFAYLRGTRIENIPDVKGMKQIKLKYQRNLDAPFINAETKEPFVYANFVVFDMDGSVKAFIK